MAVFVPSEVITDPDALSATVKLTTETRAATSEIFIDTTPAGTLGSERTIQVAIDASNDMKEAGLTLKCLYSFLKDRWKADANLIKFPFPMTPITDEQFEFTNGWKLEDTVTSGTGDDGTGVTTPYLIRTGGWAVNQGPGTNDSERWVNVITLGELDSNDQVYYRQVNDTTTAPTDFLLEGRVNQAIQFYTDTNADGTPDSNLSSFLEVFVRTFGKTYSQTDLEDIGAADGVTYQAYRFPLVNSSDVKITASQAAASGDDIALSNITGNSSNGTVTVTTGGNHGLANGDYVDVTGTTNFNSTNNAITTTGATTFTFTETNANADETSGNVSGTYFNNMSMSWANTADNTQQTGFNDTFDTTGVSVPEAYFTVNIDADVANNITPNPSAETIYTWIQAQLKKTSDINTNTSQTGVRRGDITPLKARFIGDDLYTLGQADVPGSQDFEGVYITDYADADQNRLHFWGYGSEENDSAVISVIGRVANGQVTVDTTADHGFANGDYITITNVTSAGDAFTGNYEITTVPDANTFTYDQSSTTVESGTVSGTSLASPAEFQNLTFPFVSTLTLSFNSNLVNDGDGIFRVFFLNDDAPGDNTGRDFGTKDALLVKDNGNADIAGNITQATETFNFAYDSNIQRGASTAATDAPIVVVAIGLDTAQYVKVDDQVIQRGDLTVSLVAPLERNYDPGSV